MASGKDEIKENMAEDEKPAKSVVETKNEEEDGDSSEEELGLLEKPIEILETRRERKKVERLSLDNAAKPKKEELDFTKGRGVKLGDIAAVKYELDRTLSAELKPLHKLLYKREGKASTIKKNIKAFCGFPFEKETKQYADLEWAMEKFTNVGLQRLCEIFGLNLKGKRDELKLKVLEFLMEPFQTEKKVPLKESKPKKKNTAKRKSEDSDEKSPKKKKKSTDNSDDEDEDEDDDEAKSDEAKSDEEEKKKKETKKGKKKEAKSKPKKTKATVIKLPTPSKKRKDKEEKSPKKTSPKKAKKQATEDSSDDEPLSKKTKTDAPTDEDLKQVVTKLLDGADLETVTMKMICKQVFDLFPGQDLTDKKSFIKETVKQIIS